MKISLASDHAGFLLKKEICSFLKEKGIMVLDHGVFGIDCGFSKPEGFPESVDYPDYVPFVVNDVLTQRCNLGVLLCASGIGMSIMANRYAGIRAGLCYDVQRTVRAKQHNDINILCTGADFVTFKKARKIISAFINTNFSGDERHCRRLKKFNDLGEKGGENIF